LLAVVPFEATDSDVEQLVKLHAKVLGAPDDEQDEAARIVRRVLGHRIITDARAAATVHREAPVSIVVDGTLIDGQVDLAYETNAGWTVVDFKTDAEIGVSEGVYRRQVALYAHAIAQTTQRPARGILLRV
jgi:ATP-dependent helicase/nuclease subunit A